MTERSDAPHQRYETIGAVYENFRRPDPRIGAAIADALGTADRVIDVGSGTGSYQPTVGQVVAVEPSWTMISKRSPGAAPVIQAAAESLPVATQSFDAALAVLTIHHWSDYRAGLRELARVADRQLILTSDAELFARFWLVEEYLPEIGWLEASLPQLAEVLEILEVDDVVPVAVPADCIDGFCGAYWRRPHAYLDPGARLSISWFSRCDPGRVRSAMRALEADLLAGRWQERHADLLQTDSLDLGYRLVVGRGVTDPAVGEPYSPESKRKTPQGG